MASPKNKPVQPKVFLGPLLLGAGVFLPAKQHLADKTNKLRLATAGPGHVAPSCACPSVSHGRLPEPSPAMEAGESQVPGARASTQASKAQLGLC